MSASPESEEPWASHEQVVNTAAPIRPADWPAITGALPADCRPFTPVYYDHNKKIQTSFVFSNNND